MVVLDLLVKVDLVEVVMVMDLDIVPITLMALIQQVVVEEDPGKILVDLHQLKVVDEVDLASL